MIPSRLQAVDFASRHGFKGGLVAAATLASLWVYGNGSRPQSRPISEPVAQMRTFKAVAAPVIVHLDAVGEIQPGSRTVVVAPFEGFIREKAVDIGAQINKGDPILVMETTELNAKMRDAESTLLKAAMAADSLSKWETNPEVFKAQRAISAAETQLVRLKQQQRDAKALFDRGIIARDEFEGLDQQVKAQNNQIASLRQDLDSVLDRGNPANRRMAELALDNARANMDELKSQAAQTIVRASSDGIIMRAPVPSASERAEAPTVERGVHLARGQALFTIAGVDKFAIEARINEVDINKIHVDQPVEIESDSFAGPPIQGEIASVGVEADQAGDNGGTARFVVRAVFSVGDARRASIRVGMSARLTITTYANQNAIVVPADAILSREGQPFVRLVGPAPGEAQNVAVELGAATPTGVEIKSGLAAGAVVLLP
jgi:HlyD family secretion protein